MTIPTDPPISSGGGPANTDALPEGTTNLYFTASRVLATALSNLLLVAGAIAPTDSILVAFGKLQYQLRRFSYNSVTTAFIPVLDSLDWGQRLDYTWKPPTTGNSVNPAKITNLVIDTSLAGTGAGSHAIGELTVITNQGGGYLDLAFAREPRFAIKNAGTVGMYIDTKYVFEPDTTNSGTCQNFVMRQFDDMTASVTWIGTISDNLLDPRIVSRHAGGIISYPQIISGNYTFKDQDSGKVFFLNTASNVTWTIPSTVSDGFRVKIVQGVLGGLITLVSGGRAVLSNASRTQTQYSYDSVEVLAAGGGAYLLYDWNDTLPTYSVNTSAATTSASTTNATVPALTVNLEANSTYELSFDCAYTTTAITQSLKLGFASTANGAVFIIDGGVQISNVNGPANTVMGTLNSTASTVAGTASVITVEQNAFLRGKIITAGTAGTFAIQVGAISTASTLTIPAGKAPLMIKKIK